MHQSSRTFANFLAAAENRSALLAVQELAEALTTDQPFGGNPLLLFGPTGTGKTHLASALVDQVTRRRSDLAVVHLSAGDFTQAYELAEGEENQSLFTSAREADLLLVEDLQHLHSSAVVPFTELVDSLLTNGQQLLLTANAGPQELRHGNERFPARLVNRLAGGMVVALQPLQMEGRLRLLTEQTQHLNISQEVLTWLARNLTGGMRQLLGAMTQLEALAETTGSLDLNAVGRHFQVQANGAKLTVDHITHRVGHYFRVEPDQLRSQRRWRNVLVPRQVSMYLTRRLTKLSLEQIGVYFGGRDHTTVLHACQKIEEALDKDATLSRAVRQLQAELL